MRFFRYFLAPGVGHCGGPGPGSIAPANPMQQVIDWVETGQAPAVLNASGTINGQPVTRPLCPYPDGDAVYTGGDPTMASSYTCSSRHNSPIRSCSTASTARRSQPGTPPSGQPSGRPGPAAVSRGSQDSGPTDALWTTMQWALPDVQRIAITLMDVCGFTAAQVAAITGTPRGTVLARVHRGRKTLALSLAGEHQPAKPPGVPR